MKLCTSKTSTAQRGVSVSQRRVTRPVRASYAPTRAYLVDDVSRYLAEAAQQIFSPLDNKTSPPWERSAVVPLPSQLAQLRQLHSTVQAHRRRLEGCTDPGAANFNPSANSDDGSCLYMMDTNESAQEFITGAINSVFSHNFKGDASEPAEYFNAGYASRGRTQRETRKDIGRLARFESVVQRAIDHAEGKSNKA